MSYINHFVADQLPKMPQKKSEKTGACAPKKEGKGKKIKALRESPGQAKTPVVVPDVRVVPAARSPAHPARHAAPRAAPQHTRAINRMISIQHRFMGSGIILTVLRGHPFPHITSQIVYHLAVRLEHPPPVTRATGKATHSAGTVKTRFQAITAPGIPIIPPRIAPTFWPTGRPLPLRLGRQSNGSTRQP